MKDSRSFVLHLLTDQWVFFLLSATGLARMAAARLALQEFCGIVPDEKGELSRKGHGRLQIGEKIRWAGPMLLMQVLVLHLSTRFRSYCE